LDSLTNLIDSALETARNTASTRKRSKQGKRPGAPSIDATSDLARERIRFYKKWLKVKATGDRTFAQLCDDEGITPKEGNTWKRWVERNIKNGGLDIK
jgi:hypothetical protein